MTEKGILNKNEKKEIILRGAEKSETVEKPNSLIYKRQT